MVVIISVALILMTAISYIAPDGAMYAYAAKPVVSCDSYVVMSGSTSEVVLEKHAARKLQPGNLTLLVTAMVVIDNMYNDAELKNTVDITDKLAGYGSTFRKGETVSVGDLLTAMLTAGDRQAAEALATYSASKRKIFINEMNSKAMSLGIMDTQFENPSGEYSTKQYSTASDLAVVTQAAFRYTLIKDALAKKGATISVTSKEGGREIEISGTNLFLSEEAGKSYKYAIGGISGTMGPPVDSVQFAAVSVKDDMQMIAVMMDSNPAVAVMDAKKLLEYGDSKATKNTIVKKGKLKGYARVKGGAVTRVGAYTATQGFAYVPPEGSDDLIQTQVAMFDGLEAPLSEGTKVGEFRIFVADELKGTVDLVTKKEVNKGWPPSKIYISNRATIVLGVLLVLILAFVIRVIHVKKRREKRREAIRRQKIRALARKQLEIDEDRKRRNWTGVGYADMPPRTSDIRKTSVEQALSGDQEGTGSGRNSMNGRNSRGE